MPKPFLVRDLEKTKYPDPEVMRFFFKEKLFTQHGKVLELGCGSANNLLLFGHYSWIVAGIEADPAIADAGSRNLDTCGIDGFVRRSTLPDIPRAIIECAPYQVLLMPGVMYYMSRSSMTFTFERVAPLLDTGAWIFITMRGMGDYRYHRGQEVGRNEFVLATPETGEAGLINTFYHEWEIMELLAGYFDFYRDDAWVLHQHFENKLNDHHMLNHDITIWGRRAT